MGIIYSYEIWQLQFHPEDGDSIDLCNVGILPQHYTVLQPKIRNYSFSFMTGTNQFQSIKRNDVSYILSFVRSLVAPSYHFHSHKTLNTKNRRTFVVEAATTDTELGNLKMEYAIWNLPR
jgi:hypothetical protein